MTRRRASIRATAIRRAQEAKAQRDAERIAREREIEAALADYFEAVGRAAALRTDAQRKAGKLLADAEQAAAVPEQAIRAAVGRLRTLTGAHADVAALCGLTLPAVRALLRDGDCAPAALATASLPGPDVPAAAISDPAPPLSGDEP
jgi:hypothetical protein